MTSHGHHAAVQSHAASHSHAATQGHAAVQSHAALQGRASDLQVGRLAVFNVPFEILDNFFSPRKPHCLHLVTIKAFMSLTAQTSHSFFIHLFLECFDLGQIKQNNFALEKET